MKKFKNYIINWDNKRAALYNLFFNGILMIAYFCTDEKLKNGYQFFFLFISILPVDILFIFMLLRSVYEFEAQPKQPFRLMKYPVYFMIIIFLLGPFLYLWSMRDVISQLKW